MPSIKTTLNGRVAAVERKSWQAFGDVKAGKSMVLYLITDPEHAPHALRIPDDHGWWRALDSVTFGDVITCDVEASPYVAATGAAMFRYVVSDVRVPTPAERPAVSRVPVGATA